MSRGITTVSMIQSKIGFLQRTNDPTDAMAIIRGIQKELGKLINTINWANEKLTDLYVYLSENKNVEIEQGSLEQKMFKEQIEKAFAPLEEIFWN